VSDASMESCPHKVLVLCTVEATKLRCRHCHLTISRDELGGGGCPECAAERGVVHHDFDEVATEAGKVRYRCEECDLIIEIDP